MVGAGVRRLTRRRVHRRRLRASGVLPQPAPELRREPAAHRRRTRRRGSRPHGVPRRPARPSGSPAASCAERVAAVAVALDLAGRRARETASSPSRATTREAIVAALAALAVGATLSTAAPDMGAFAVLSRFGQLEPALLIASLRDEAQHSSVPLGRARSARSCAGSRRCTRVVALDDGPAPGRAHAPAVTGWPISPSRDARAPWPSRGRGSRSTIRSSSCSRRARPARRSASSTAPAGRCSSTSRSTGCTATCGAADKLFFQTSAAWMMWNWQLSALACGARDRALRRAGDGPGHALADRRRASG